MAPGWTDYRERVLYQTYDVTELVRSGANVIEALLAPGWYSTSLEWLQQPNNYGDTPPALRAQLRIEYADGKVEWVGTDASWKADTSFIVHSELYDGETQDLRELYRTFNRTGVDAEPGKQVEIIHPKEIKIEAQAFPPIGIDQALSVVKMTEPKPGVFIYDFGQNMAGVEKLVVSGAAGTDVQVRVGEALNPDGTLYTENLRTAKATDHFILSGLATDVLVPHFTFHGFRYIEITGVKNASDVHGVFAQVLHTDFNFTAKLKTGNEMINKLWSNILWGQRSNFVGLPTDCPQRDERLGWSADAQVFWRAASYNAALASFTRKFAADLRGTQVGTPYLRNLCAGNGENFARHRSGLERCGRDHSVDVVAADRRHERDRRELGGDEEVCRRDRLTESRWHLAQRFGYSVWDWLSLEGRTQEDLVATAYWAYDVNMLRQMAHATGRNEEEQRYAKLEEKIRNAFQTKFVKAKAYIPGADNSPSPFGDINNPNAKARGGDTQTSYVLALHMNLLPDEMRSQAAGRLVKKIEDNHGLLGTGFCGYPVHIGGADEDRPYEAGLRSAAEQRDAIVGIRDRPWRHDHVGAVERREMMGDPQMNSYNHYAYGAVADWIYRFAAGVDASPLNAGFHTVVLHPVFDARLSPLEFIYKSSYGEIKSSWTVKGKTAEWNITLPANTTGLLELKDTEAVRYKVDGVRLSESPLAKKVDGGFELEAGSYRFEVGRE